MRSRVAQIALNWWVVVLALGSVVTVSQAVSAQGSKPTTIEAVSNLTQQAPAGSNVPSAPEIKVLDQHSNVMPGVVVAFSVTAGNGSISASADTTDATGVARITTWRLGSTPGGNAVRASVSSTQGQNPTPVTFNATGILVPASLEGIPPMSGTWTAGADVQQPPAVLVRDQFHQPLAGVSVSFGVTAGGGSIAPTPANLSTQSDGIARLATWTLGQNSGTNKVMAKVSGLTPVEFTVTTPFLVVVFVKSADTKPIANSQVCVGSRSDVDQYATVKDAGTIGRVTFQVPAASEYGVTASKGSFVGQTGYLSAASGHSGVITLTLAGGTGGPACPGAVMTIDATTITPGAPEPLPDLDLDVNQSSNPLIGGTKQTYTVKVYNRGGKAASAIGVRHSISSNLDFLSATGDKGFVCSRSGTTVNCSSGTLTAGDSATIRVATWLSSGASSGQGILFGAKADPDNAIPESNETNNQAAAATTSQAGPARLGEQALSARGRFDVAPDLLKQLDCKKFGSSYVMVGISGQHGQGVDRIRLLCETMEPAGAISKDTVRTEQWYSDASTTGKTFRLKCAQGSAVSGITGTLSITDDRNYDGQIRSLTLGCAPIGTLGLTSLASTPVGPAGTPTTRPFGPDSCGGGRPGRALKVASEVGYPGIGVLFAGFVVIGVQLICEQPVVP